jgi:excisionase family DNA binding protein
MFLARRRLYLAQLHGRSGQIGVYNRDGPDNATCGRSAPTLALSVEQACEALGVSWDTWRAHIESDVRLVRLGRRKLIPVSELQAWLDRHAESVGAGE